MECGIALKSSIFDILATGSSWAVGLVGAWARVLLKVLLIRGPIFYNLPHIIVIIVMAVIRLMCDLALVLMLLVCHQMLLLFFADPSYKDKVPISCVLRWFMKSSRKSGAIEKQFNSCFPVYRKEVRAYCMEERWLCRERCMYGGR